MGATDEMLDAAPSAAVTSTGTAQGSGRSAREIALYGLPGGCRSP
ncbi:MAG TPA: hypothetical protein VFK69_07650 [Candidatus Eisenbacteria bacterium]|nr:hypothetical protein [Candidatus Eisenbacteria bacterium]